MTLYICNECLADGAPPCIYDTGNIQKLDEIKEIDLGRVCHSANFREVEETGQLKELLPRVRNLLAKMYQRKNANPTT